MINLPVLLKQIAYSKKFKSTDLKNDFLRCFADEKAQDMFVIVILISFYATLHKQQSLNQINNFLSNNPNIEPELKEKLIYFRNTISNSNDKTNSLINNYNDLIYFNSVIDKGKMQKHLYHVLANSNSKFSTNCKNIDLYYLKRNIEQENRLARNLIRFLKIVKKDIHRQISYLQKDK
tara:strand:+ start:3019 stop:3552 length:534 start_codon:yes stop_codon:yes gene_type:complete